MNRRAFFTGLAAAAAAPVLRVPLVSQPEFVRWVPVTYYPRPGRLTVRLPGTIRFTVVDVVVKEP